MSAKRVTGDHVAPAAVIGSVAVAVAAIAASAWLVVRAERGPAPEFREAERRAPRASDPGRLELAGSGTNLPLTRRLAAAFERAHPEIEVIVHDSIGTTGGVRAVADGVVDVGLASRPLHPHEAVGLEVDRYARVAVVFAAHPGVPARDARAITRDRLVAAYAGEPQRWSDGTAMVPIQRERGDSGHRAVSEVVPEFARVNEDAWHAGRLPVVYTDRAMELALLETPGAVGVCDLGSITAQDLPLRVLSVDGLEPSAQAVASGDYPFAKDLAFVWRGEPGEALTALLAFARSEEGRAIMRESGYIPAGGDAP